MNHFNSSYSCLGYTVAAPIYVSVAEFPPPVSVHQTQCCNVITLTLLHPLQDIPVQSWAFEDESMIRIGRATDNQVVLYSAVVSRHHVEIRRNDASWDVINLGTNGTYLDGKRIAQAPLKDGAVLRLARSGPKIQIHLDATTAPHQHKPKVAATRPASASLKTESTKDTLLIEKKQPEEQEVNAESRVTEEAQSFTPDPLNEAAREEEEQSTRPDLQIIDKPPSKP